MCVVVFLICFFFFSLTFVLFALFVYFICLVCFCFACLPGSVVLLHLFLFSLFAWQRGFVTYFVSFVWLLHFVRFVSSFCFPPAAPLPVSLSPLSRSLYPRPLSLPQPSLQPSGESSSRTPQWNKPLFFPALSLTLFLSEFIDCCQALIPARAAVEGLRGPRTAPGERCGTRRVNTRNTAGSRGLPGVAPRERTAGRVVDGR